MENPYLPPKTTTLDREKEPDAVSIEQTKHRSFRLTREPDTKSIAEISTKDALLFSVLLQLMLIFITALVLDGGVLFSIFVGGSIFYWISVSALSFVKSNKFSLDDKLLIKYGFGICVLLAVIIQRIYLVLSL